MSAAHTPGPWLDWNTLEWLHEPKHLLARTEDARLIAAAPDMLAMLHRAADFVQPFNRAQDFLEEIEALIAKAIGRTPDEIGDGCE